jgi:hypothetical protein
MNEHAADSVAADFERRFGLRDGDYIEFDRNSSHGPQRRQARILYAEGVYENEGGGYSANVVVLPLLATGELGRSLNLLLAINANRTGLRGLNGPVAHIKQTPDRIR